MTDARAALASVADLDTDRPRGIVVGLNGATGTTAGWHGSRGCPAPDRSEHLVIDDLIRSYDADVALRARLRALDDRVFGVGKPTGPSAHKILSLAFLGVFLVILPVSILTPLHVLGFASGGGLLGVGIVQAVSWRRSVRSARDHD